MERSQLILLAILAIGGVLGSIGVYFAYQYTLQPNIQATAISVSPLTSPQTINWLDMGRVTGTGSFNYHPINTTAEYVLMFSSIYSASELTINFKYTTHWPDYLWENFTLLPGQSRAVQVHANAGQQLGGDFWVSGGAVSDVGFRIIAYACTESVSFTSTLVNLGSADGYADVAFMVDGISAWTYRYFVPAGGSVPVSGSISIPNCVDHTFNVVVQKQYKP